MYFYTLTSSQKKITKTTYLQNLQKFSLKYKKINTKEVKDPCARNYKH